MFESGLNSFDKLINNPDFADVVLVVKDNVEFLVHSPIITLNSPYYNAALKPHWKQSKTKEDRIKLTHRDIDKETMKIILDYLYTFKIDEVNKDNIGKVFMAADFLGMAHLVEYCKNELDEENSFEFFEASYALDDLSFARSCIGHFRDLEKVKESALSVSLPMILFIIACILNKRSPVDFSNIDCWELIWSWSKANSNEELNESVLEYVLEVLNEMRRFCVFFRFDAEEYKEIIDNVIETFNDSQSRIRVLQLLKEHRMEGDIVPQKFSSLVLSSKNISIQRRIIAQLSKFTIESERNILVAGKAIIGKGSKDISVKFGNSSVSWKLLYRASEHKFSASSFHSLCDNKGPTITLVKSKNGRICAAYNSDHWSSGRSCSPNSKGYLCSVVDSNGDITFTKFTPKTNIAVSHGAYNEPSYGPTFGVFQFTFGVGQSTYDLYLANSCNINTNSYSDLGHSYRQVGPNTTFVSEVTLLGSSNFQIDEYEVYGISIA